MIAYLRVENFAVVEKVELHFGAGLNVLTGETGAGKSILIDAINLFLKKKVPDNCYRGGDNKLVVEAMFIQGEDECVLRRESAGSRALCFLDGNMVPFQKLKETAEDFLNIYGQHDHSFLLNVSNHRTYLDEFSRSGEILAKMAGVCGQIKSLQSDLRALKAQSDRASERLDYIDFVVSEIEALNMSRGEDEELEQRVKILSSAEEILSRGRGVIGDFYQGDRSVYNKVAEHRDNLDYLKGIYPDLSSLVEEVDKFYNLLPDLSSTLSEIIGKIDYSEDELNRLEGKLTALDRLKSKHKLDLAGLLDKMEALKKERETLADLDFSIEDKHRDLEKRLARYRELNAELRALRKKKAQELSALVEAELSKLEMKRARFLVSFDEIDPDIDNIGDKGTDKLEFYFSSNPGQEPAQVRNVASGGELSRLMLVLKSILEDDDDAVYIFDEIDSGIGGKTAEFVGEKLRRIAAQNQVVCISHLPHIASFANTHFLINKEYRDEQTFSYVREVSGEERIREIGRMMVGSGVNDDVLKAAKNLLKKNGT